MQTCSIDHTPLGYVAYRGKGTYWAKERLKRLGGYWDPAQKCWFVPKARAELAEAAIAFAQRVGRALTVEEVDYGLPPRSPLVSEATIRCYECGQTFRVSEVVARGGVPEDWYCGCAEPQNLPRRRPFGARRGT